MVQTPPQGSYETDQRVSVTAPADRVSAFDAESGVRLR